MKIRLFWILIAVAALSIPCMGHAEFYRYTDQNGVLRFTDDITQVPEDQRPKANRYESREQSSPADTDSKTDLKEAVKDETDRPAGPSEGEKNDVPPGVLAEKKALIADLEKLVETEAGLNKEHVEIEKERKALEEAKKTVKTRKAVSAHNARASLLNERIDAYEKRRKAYVEAVAAYNKRAKEVSQPQPKEQPKE